MKLIFDIILNKEYNQNNFLPFLTNFIKLERIYFIIQETMEFLHF